jgi:hypothetical protein
MRTIVTAALIVFATVAAPACVSRAGAPTSPATAQAGAAPAPVDPGEEPDPILARGQHSTLTRDNAVAFYESLIFSLAQVGYEVSAEQVSPERVIGELAALYDGASRDDQIALATWRRAWTAVRTRWTELPPSDQRAFVHAVLVASFGEQAAGQLDRRGGTALADASTSSGSSDSLIPAFDHPGSDCWSSSGCHLGAVAGDRTSGQY